eukprot:756511-Pleurochrysis_carterae.AAC.1
MAAAAVAARATRSALRARAQSSTCCTHASPASFLTRYVREKLQLCLSCATAVLNGIARPRCSN